MKEPLEDQVILEKVGAYDVIKRGAKDRVIQRSLKCAVPGLTIGIYEKALPLSVDWPQRLKMAESMGFDFVEMSLDSSEQRLARLDWSKDKRRQLRQVIADSNITILTMCLSAHRIFPLGSSSMTVREKGLIILRKAIELASDLGIRIVQIAGYDTEGGQSTRSSRRYYLEGLRCGVIWASERAVMLGLENQDSGFVDSPTTAACITRQIDSPYLQLYMDIGNMVANGFDAVSEISAAKGCLVGVHVKDARPGEVRGVGLGEGDVPFDTIFRQLANGGFYGPLTIEMWNEDRPESLAICGKARQWLEQHLKAAWHSNI